MTENKSQTKVHSKTKGGKILPALCSVFGTVLLLAVILSALPLSLPRLFGMRVYSVISGSMEPTLPVGSAVYVETVDPAEIRAGDIIAFSDEGVVVTHRVVEVRPDTGEFITKGDANDTPDIYPIARVNILGRVKAHFPLLGKLMMLYATREGKMAMAFFAFCGLLFRLMGSMIAARQKNAERAEKAPENETEGEDRKEERKEP